MATFTEEKTETQKYELIPYQTESNVIINVTQMNDDVWLTAEQIAKLYGVQRSAITKHINNIYADHMFHFGTCGG